jgi:transposase
VLRDVVSDEAWAVIGSLFPPVKATGRPPVDRRRIVEATVWRYRTGAPWRDLPERFGNWNLPSSSNLAIAASTPSRVTSLSVTVCTYFLCLVGRDGARPWKSSPRPVFTPA